MNFAYLVIAVVLGNVVTEMWDILYNAKSTKK